MVSRDDWFPSSQKWGHYEEDDADADFQTRASTPARSNAEPARSQPQPVQPQPARAEPVQSQPALAGPEAVRVAQQLAGDLAAQSRSYPGIAWAVSVHEEAGRAALYATSNEGAGYLPPGLRWDPRLRHVFGPSVTRTELPLWLGLANPARTAADHYLFLRSARPGLRLTAIISTQPPGDAVTALLRALGAAGLPPSEPGILSPSAMSRLDAVSDEGFAALIAGIPVRQLWAAGLDLATDAAQRCGYHRFEPQLAAALDGLRAGNAHPAHADHAWHGLWRLTAGAQAHRVPDTRLGPLDPSSAGPSFAQVVELCAGYSYAQPFIAARTTAILHALLRCRLADEPLSDELLAELAYEHACVAEDTAPARALLAQHSTTGDEDL